MNNTKKTNITQKTKQEENTINDAIENSSADKRNPDSTQFLKDNFIEKEEIVQQIEPVEELELQEINYFGIGILSISGIFLIITLIFAIF